MTELIMSILLNGTKIFTEERRRYFSKKLLEHQTAVKDAENARFPDYNDDKLALAIQSRDIFLESYHSEFNKRVGIAEALLAKVTP